MALCKKPFKKGNLEFGCGQCMPCRIRHRRLWANRMVLESLCHGDSCFVTLTYKYVQYGGLSERTATLDPSHPTLWLKRLRKALDPIKIRYFLCGEYGDESQRPHYHAALFGIGRSFTSLIESTWGVGHVYVGDLTATSANYIAGYVTKKLTKEGDPRLYGRYPEYSRQSRRPGIGALAVPELASSISSLGGAEFLLQNGDVPNHINIGGKHKPLGRYLTSKLREAYGFEEINTPKQKLYEMSKEMSELHEAEWILAAAKNKTTSEFYKERFDKKNQKILNLETKQKIFSKRKVL